MTPFMPGHGDATRTSSRDFLFSSRLSSLLLEQLGYYPQETLVLPGKLSYVLSITPSDNLASYVSKLVLAD